MAEVDNGSTNYTEMDVRWPTNPRNYKDVEISTGSGLYSVIDINDTSKSMVKCNPDHKSQVKVLVLEPENNPKWKIPIFKFGFLNPIHQDIYGDKSPEVSFIQKLVFLMFKP